MSDFNGEKSTGETINEVARDAGAAVAKGFEKVKDWVKDHAGVKEPMGFAKLDEMKPGMEVISSCGCRVGTVDHMEGNAIKLTRKDSPDGQHHFIPVGWVARVDSHVHLNKDVSETKQGWNSPASV